ncbi:hypothetical protein EVAR_52837_1 [Eumeta japonica]|uniref:MADF domain-containing protein n=1 Tax=Eumeta variegata TaxID=151549 RepID=A0A4C1YAG2_EUMVA|nr:hypothetical protein EVAR_52837_1 [Eumeta japonica]
MTRKLSEDETLKLVQLYGENECLWDIKSQNYRNKKMRGTAVLNIVQQMQIEGLTPSEDNSGTSNDDADAEGAGEGAENVSRSENNVNSTNSPTPPANTSTSNSMKEAPIQSAPSAQNAPNYPRWPP